MTHINIVAALIVVCVITPQVLEGIPLDPECEVTKGCFYDCEDETLCEFMVSWVDEGNTVKYTLETNVEWLNVWIAIAFSDDQLMGNDSVTGCKHFNGITEIFNAKNPVHSSPAILANEGVSLIDSSLSHDVFKCVFERDKSAGASMDRFDLFQPWYLLFAKGELTEAGDLKGHSLYDSYNSGVKYDPSFRPTVPPPVTTESTPATSARAGTTVPTTPSHVTTPQPSGPLVIKVKGCGKTVGCFSDCVDLTCGFIVSWYTEGQDAVYTITSIVAWNSSGWVAVGFSSDAYMGNDDIMGCVSDKSGRVIHFNGWNSHYKSPAMYTDNEIKLIAHSSQDGSVSCTFRRPIAAASSGNLTILQDSRRVNVTQPWTILFSRGPGGIKADMAILKYHGNNRFVSGSKISANDRVDFGSVYVEYPLVKAHGSLMIAAWIFFSSMGILIPRYYRTLSKSKIFCGHAWVTAHRMCMLYVIIISLAGFLTIYAQSKRYSYAEHQKDYQVAHPVIGIAILVLMILNPTIALYRPPPRATTRLIFNWIHGIVGLIVQILAVINIFLGVLMTKADVPFFLIYILGAYTAWEVVVFLVLETVSCFGCRSYAALNDGTAQQTIQERSVAPESATVLWIKRIIFCLHCCVLLSFAASLIVLLVLGNKYLQG